MLPRKFATWWDALVLFLLLGVALLAIAVWWRTTRQQPKAEYAIITVDNQEVARLPLDNDTLYSLPGHPKIIIEVKGHTAFFKTSDCPDQICVRTGALLYTGQTAACLPNHVLLQISADRSNAPDMVAG